jgi:lysophospholipase L1-like esterase
VTGSGASSPATRFVNVALSGLDKRWVDNRGVSGSTATDLATMLGASPPAQRAVYVVMIGNNEMRLNGMDGTAQAAYSTALDTIFAALRAAGPTSRIIAVPQPYLANYSLFSPYNNGSDAVVDAYNARLATAVAAVDGVMANPNLWDKATMLADGLHPNDSGHAELARAVAAA